METENRSRPCPACQSVEARKCGTKNKFEILVCSGCRSLFTSRLPAADEVEDYDAYYTEANLSVPDFIAVRLREIVGDFNRFRSSNRLLDIGFGSGTILAEAHNQDWNVFGTEVSRPAFEQARARGFQVWHGTLKDAGFDDGQFDVITASEILEHLDDPLGELTEIARILRPGGLLWATTPSARSLSFRVMKERWTVISPPEHTQLYSKRGARLMLEKAGFSSISISTLGLNPAELVNHFRRGRSSDEERFDRVTTGYELNERMTVSRAGKRVKQTANIVLNALQLGDSLKIFAQK